MKYGGIEGGEIRNEDNRVEGKIFILAQFGRTDLSLNGERYY